MRTRSWALKSRVFRGLRLQTQAVKELSPWAHFNSRDNLRIVKIFYATPNSQQLPPGHRFPMEKYELLRHRLSNEVQGCELQLAEPVTEGQLSLAHDVEYVSAVFEGRLSPAQQRDIGFPWSPGMVERARGSSGATLMACRTALQEGVAANIAGGTHHAYKDQGSGFCVFNDTAVAARSIQLEAQRASAGSFGAKQMLRVGVIDLDVHQGNGTAKIFEQDPSVFTLSIHGAKNFPFKKEVSDLDVELADGCTDQEYLQALEAALLRFDSLFKPDLIIYLAGADPYLGDRLGRLGLSMQGLQKRDQTVFDWAYSRGVPIAFSMAGGYAVPISDTVQININTFKIAQEYSLKYAALR